MAHAPPTTSFQTYLGVDEKKKVLKHPLPLPRNVKSMAKVLKQGEDGVYKNGGNYLTKEGFDYTEIEKKPNGKIVSIKRREASENNAWIQAIRLYYSTINDNDKPKGKGKGNGKGNAKPFPKVMSPTKYRDDGGTNSKYIDNYRKVSKIYVGLLEKQLANSNDPKEIEKIQEKINKNKEINKIQENKAVKPELNVDSQDLERRQKYQKLFDAEYNKELRKFRADLYQKRGELEESKSDFYIKNSL